MVKRRRRNRTNGRKAMSVNLGDIAAFLVIASAVNKGNAGDVVGRLRVGNVSGAIEIIGPNLKQNIGQVLSGVGIGVGAKLLRRTKLAPRIRIPKLVSIGV